MVDNEYTLRLSKLPKLRPWLSPILPQLRLGKKLFYAKFWASERAGIFVRVTMNFPKKSLAETKFT